MNRLTQDVDPVTGKTTTYTYDTRGNILSKTAAGQTVTYTYGDSTWKDLLTAYNGPPRGVQDLAARRGRPAKYLWASHAEANLIAFAARLTSAK